ncbi:hypothetical protein M0R89_07575 [Halorussus limi]|uniref:Uncharacterized protein n=1 Tax=Halorussus limi TaxID=2938695 RepID=A0A8U0HYA9_9EURY|nr:hypothetical protein [Halorussus limi]UPV75908.1 hypothetical protein M0R89_07575 [Halorussus limi]
MNRRTALKTLGAAGAAFGGTSVLGTVSAASPNEQYFAIQNAANEIRENKGQEAMLQFLDKRGIDYVRVEKPMVVEEKGDQVSTNDFSNVDGGTHCDICLDFVLYTNSNSTIYTIDMSWDYKLESGDYGQQPNDGAALYYSQGKWDYYSRSLSESTYSSQYVTVGDGNNQDGAAFSVDDVSSGDGDSLYAGLNIQPIGDYSYSERKVFGEYMHTWTTVDVNASYGVSFPAGVSVSYSVDTNVNEEVTGTEGDGDTLMELDQSQATLD